MQNKPTINLKNDNFGAILNCAVRYSLGRRTYMPGLVMDFVGPLLPYVSDRTLWCMERDIKDFVEPYAECPPKSIIDKMDIEQWERFLQAVWKAIDERTAEKEIKRERVDLSGIHYCLNCGAKMELEHDN